jgi:hypothetical protein
MRNYRSELFASNNPAKCASVPVSDFGTPGASAPAAAAAPVLLPPVLAARSALHPATAPLLPTDDHPAMAGADAALAHSKENLATAGADAASPHSPQTSGNDER